MKNWRWAAVLTAAAGVIALGSGSVASAAGAKPGPSQVPAQHGVAVASNMGTLRKPGTVAGRLTTATGSKVAPAQRQVPLAPTGYSVQSAFFTNPNGAQTFGSVDCPAGTVAWGGGLFGSSSSVAQGINSSYPLVSSSVAVGWAGYMNNSTGFDSSFTVYATCAAKPKKYSVQSLGFSNLNGAQTSGSVVCPIVNATTGKRSKALGGGAFGSSSSLFQNINTSIPSSKNSWRVDMDNASGADSSFTVYVICGNRTGYERNIGAAVSNPAGAQTGASVACTSGKVETGGGGFSSSASTAVTMNSTYPFSSGWGVFENNASGLDATVTPYAVCVG